MLDPVTGSLLLFRSRLHEMEYSTKNKGWFAYVLQGQRTPAANASRLCEVFSKLIDRASGIRSGRTRCERPCEKLSHQVFTYGFAMYAAVYFTLGRDSFFRSRFDFSSFFPHLIYIPGFRLVRSAHHWYGKGAYFNLCRTLIKSPRTPMAVTSAPALW